MEPWAGVSDTAADYAYNSNVDAGGAVSNPKAVRLTALSNSLSGPAGHGIRVFLCSIAACQLSEYTS